MINQLKNIFPSLIIHNTLEQSLDENYEWFINNSKDIIGINKNELTDKDRDLLHTFLEPYNTRFPVPSEREQAWKKYIFDQGQLITLDDNALYRFIYFSISSTNQIEPKLFKEAINELFAKQISILWLTQQEGIMIEEEMAGNDEAVSYEQIIDVLMSDLYVKINLLVGPFQRQLDLVKEHYAYILQSGRIAFAYTDKQVLSYLEALPYMLIDQAEPAFKKEISTSILKKVATDQEMLQTIDVFLESNLNISVTAKKLYMHRNSLQYRLDKFNEQTGIDIRDFHQALPVYLSLLATRT